MCSPGRNSIDSMCWLKPVRFVYSIVFLRTCAPFLLSPLPGWGRRPPDTRTSRDNAQQVRHGDVSCITDTRLFKHCLGACRLGAHCGAVDSAGRALLLLLRVGRQ